MAILTWQNVPIPDLASSSQQGVRTASELLNRAVGNASAGVSQLQGIQDAQKAAKTQAADRFALDKMLAVRDPAQLAQMQADGSLLGPAARDVSVNTLLQAEARRGALQAEQDASYTRTQTRAADTAAPALAEAVELGVTDRPAAMAELASIVRENKLSAADTQKGMAAIVNGYLDPNTNIQGALARDNQKKRTEANKVLTLMGKAANLREVIALTDGVTDPDVAALVEQGTRERYPELVPQLLGPGANYGVATADLSKLPGGREVQDLVVKTGQVQAEHEQKLTEGAQILRGLEGKNITTTAQAAQELTKRFKEVSDAEKAYGQVHSKIKSLIADAKKAKKTLTPAEAMALVEAHSTENTWLNIENFAGGVDLDQGKMDAMALTMNDARTEYDLFKKNIQGSQKVLDLVAKYQDVGRKYQSALAGAKSRPGLQKEVGRLEKELNNIRKQLGQTIEPDAPKGGPGPALMSEARTANRSAAVAPPASTLDRVFGAPANWAPQTPASAPARSQQPSAVRPTGVPEGHVRIRLNGRIGWAASGAVPDGAEVL